MFGNRSGAPGPTPPGPSWGPPVGPPLPPSRRALTLGVLVVGVLSAAALFVSGFSLGERAGGFGGGGDAELRPLLEAYRRITTEFVGEAEPEELVEAAIRGMFETLDDPYSSYLSPSEYTQGLEGIDGEFEGIGAELVSEDPEGGPCEVAGPGCLLRVVRILPGSPAEAGGLLADDVLRAVDGTAVDGEALDEVIRRVRGPRGTSVTLSLSREGEPLEITLRRDVIRTEAVTSEILADGRVGYLRVDGFSGTSAEDFRTALAAHLDAGIERVVVDLRDDPGGYVDAAVGIASQFLEGGPVYWEARSDGSALAVHASGVGIATDPRVRVALLVNGGTASASEIVAGALQDTGRAKLVGERTFGKGTIQEWALLPGDGGGIRLSVARWLTPDKTWVHGEGIEPDLAVAPDAGQAGVDAQLEAAVSLLLAEPGAAGTPTNGAADGPRASPQPAV